MLSPTGGASQRLQGFTLDGGIAPWFLNEAGIGGRDRVELRDHGRTRLEADRNPGVFL